MRGVLLALALFAFAASGCGGGDDETTTTGGGGCENVEAPAPREPEAVEPPAGSLSAGTSYSLALETSCGTFRVELDTKLAPETTASLVALARAGYFDDTVFHRIVPGFVVQGGDPTQTGRGGPGYSTVDVPPPSAKYVKGVVAMAKSATEPPGASGSQFFVVTADDAGLPAEYAVVGEVTDGLDVVERIGELGDPATEQPTQPVVIETVTVTET